MDIGVAIMVVAGKSGLLRPVTMLEAADTAMAAKLIDHIWTIKELLMTTGFSHARNR